MILTFNELRELKDSLPDGTMHKIANELNLSVETVRNYFGGANYDRGESVGVHFEQGPNGGIVTLDDDSIYKLAKKIIEDSKN